MLKKNILLIMVSLMLTVPVFAAPAATKQPVQKPAAQAVQTVRVTPLALVANPKEFLSKKLLWTANLINFQLWA